jgi:hypothetical protein
MKTTRREGITEALTPPTGTEIALSLPSARVSSGDLRADAEGVQAFPGVFHRAN